MKRIISKIVLIFVILFGMVNTVLAEENNYIVDFTRKGNISITLESKDNNEYIEGAEISLYHIALAKEENYNLKLEYVSELSECSVSLSNLEDEKLSNEISKCITMEMPSLKQNTNKNGNVKFENLDLGLYLVMQTNIVDGYSKVDSFLVMIPKNIDNEYIYDIEATPKTEIYQVVDLVVEKVWNTTDNNIVDSIEVGLYKGTELLDKVILSKDNGWIYTWERIEKRDDYSVKEIDVPAGFTDTYRQIDNKFIITNTKTLVQTGLRLWLVELLLVSGIMLIVMGIVLEKRNKYGK